MKKNIVIGALMLIVGIVGGWLCRGYHFREEAGMVQRDTVTVFKKVHYSRMELDVNRYRLIIPDVDVKEYVVMQVDSIIYKNNIVYASAPREYYYTKVDDAEIWHSGIDSRIDSLNVFSKTTVITKHVESVPSRWRYSVDVGVDVGRGGYRYIMPSVGAEIGCGRWSIRGEAGCDVNAVKPSVYYKAGVRYNVIQKR